MSLLSIANQTATLPKAFDVPVNFDPQTDSVAGVQFDFAIPAGTTFNSVSLGPTGTAAAKQIQSAPVTGGIRVIIFGLNTTTIAKGVVATINLTPKTAGKPVFSLSNVSASTPAGQAVTIQTSVGTLTIGGSMGTDQPTFDQTLQAFLTAQSQYLTDVGSLISAVTALVAKCKTLEGQAAIDLNNELNQVTAAMASVKTSDTSVQSSTTAATGA